MKGDCTNWAGKGTRDSSRRDFMKGTLAAAIAGGIPGSIQASRPGPARTPGPFNPGGELSTRITMTQKRLIGDGVPSFSDSFVLADVSLDPAYPRRFSNYSGDLSGRYIGALSLMPPGGETGRLDSLVRRLLGFQREDGRFGNPRLSFAAPDIDREQMALLWGNGRLLVGLLEYSSARPAPEVLKAAKGLAGFLLKARESCARPEVMKRLVGQGASGFICFTQLIEAFVMLGSRTGERRYLEAAARIVPWLQPRGNQHSHGYLTTLRGIIDLHRATGDADHLRYVENAYRDLLSSSDYTIYGGVPEYFGSGPGDARAEERSRDEGCSEADFVRLSLQLWQATGKTVYLERAERCLLNEFYFNQFNTGDFGHHTAYRYGYKSTESVGRAWWCCTMHGLRAFRDVRDAVVTAGDRLIKVNLLLDGTWSAEPMSFRLTTDEGSDLGTPFRFRLSVLESGPDEVSVAVRHPDWASGYSLQLNGRRIASENADGYDLLRRKWAKGDVLEAILDYRLTLVTRSGESLNPEAIGDRVAEAAVFCGPYLLAVDCVDESAFFGEPWMGDSPVDSNMLLLPEDENQRRPAARPSTPLTKPSAHRRFRYIHGGWPEKYPLTLRPISEQTAAEPRTIAVWFRIRRA